jgi:hypothetical protein
MIKLEQVFCSCVSQVKKLGKFEGALVRGLEEDLLL